MGNESSSSYFHPLQQYEGSKSQSHTMRSSYSHLDFPIAFVQQPNKSTSLPSATAGAAGTAVTKLAPSAPTFAALPPSAPLPSALPAPPGGSTEGLVKPKGNTQEEIEVGIFALVCKANITELMKLDIPTVSNVIPSTGYTYTGYTDYIKVMSYRYRVLVEKKQADPSGLQFYADMEKCLLHVMKKVNFNVNVLEAQNDYVEKFKAVYAPHLSKFVQCTKLITIGNVYVKSQVQQKAQAYKFVWNEKAKKECEGILESEGFDLNLIDNDNYRSIFVNACVHGNVEGVKMLMRYNLNVGMQYPKDDCAYYWMVYIWNALPAQRGALSEIYALVKTQLQASIVDNDPGMAPGYVVSFPQAYDKSGTFPF